MTHLHQILRFQLPCIQLFRNKFLQVCQVLLLGLLLSSAADARDRTIEASCPNGFSLLDAPTGLCSKEVWVWRQWFFVDLGFWSFWTYYFERDYIHAETFCANPAYPVLSDNLKFCYEPNTPPLATHQTIRTYEDIPINITLAGTDAEGDELTFNITSEPTNGTVVGGGANWTYTPNPKWHGTDAMSFIANDGLDVSAVGLVTIEVAPTVALDVALDNVNLDWLSSGNAWIGQVEKTNDGIDAAQSGIIDHNQNSLLETTVEGPGTLSFYWKVSSEASYDFLRFSIDGIEQQRISGEVDWAIQSYEIASGPHTLKWNYTKDSSVESGLDMAWVDQVVWGNGEDPTPTPTPPNEAMGTGPGGNTKAGLYEYGTDFGNLDVAVSADGNTCTMENSRVKTIDLNHSSSNQSSLAFSYPCLRNTHKEINGAYSPLNDAHYFGGVVYEMYDQWYNTAPLTFQLQMKVHYSNNYENAFWDGSAMTFGDGQNYFYPLVSLDVVSHEVSHGFTDQNSDLVYSGQSGGINEAFSDIAGEAAEYYMLGSNDFMVGATIFKGDGALRYMYDPPLDGRSIGHASDYSSGMDVHYSSGVFNKAFYILANTSGWDVRKAFEIFVRANQNYWTPNTDFEEGCLGVRDAASDAGYSTADVEAAFAQVGLCPGYVPPAPVDLDIALDNTQLSWTVSGDGNWFGQTLTSYDGEDAAQSGEITHNQESVLQTTLTGPGTLTFRWKVSSEANYDYLRFFIDGSEQVRKSGSVDWEEQSFEIPSGAHIVEWKYTKDESVDRSQDAGWVDRIQWSGN
jgi:hypothetical protein